MTYAGSDPEAWALPQSYTAAQVAKAAGLDPNLNLIQACADFYWLERAENNGVPGAAKKMAEVETYLAEQFAIYLDMAVGGELRLLPVQEMEQENYCEGQYCGTGGEECYACGGWFHFHCGMCHNKECNVNKKPWSTDSPLEATVALFKCIALFGEEPDTYSCQCDEEYNGQTWRNDTPSGLFEYFDMMDYGSGGIERHEGWEAWLKFRETHGLNGLKWAVQALDNGHWNSSCGGPKWAAAAELLYDYLEGSITARVMVNMAWSMEHNGGCIFNKIFNVEGDYWQGQSKPSLHAVLVEQSNDNYGFLEQHLSKPIRSFKAYVKMLLTTKQGQRHAQEVKLYDIVAKALRHPDPIKRARFHEVAQSVAEGVHLSE